LIAKIDNEGILDVPMGDWFDDPVNLIHHTYLLHINFSHILIRNNRNKQWNQYEQHYQLRSTIYFKKTHRRTLEQYNPDHYIAINLNENNTEYYIKTQGITKQQKAINMEFEDEDFSSFINRSINPKQVSWSQFFIIDEHQLFGNTDMTIACDGGAKDNILGSFGISVSKRKKVLIPGTLDTV
jgi:hypothetical protein